jgi:WD40 repeat protein
MRTLTILCIAMLLGFGATAQSDAPYVYYYSRLLGGWVIERADGTDSRLFAQDVMPPEHQVVRQIGWSPSGEWFAWFSAEQFSTVGPTRHVAWLVGIEGTSATYLTGVAELTNGYWSEEGHLYLLDEQHDSKTIYRVDPIAQTIETVDSAVPHQNPSAFGIESVYTDERAISPDGRYELNLRNGALTDIVSGDTVHIRRFSGYSGHDVCRVRWHYDGEWFMRHDSMIYAGGGCPHGIIVANPSGTVQRELTACPLGGDCAGWLPGQVAAHLDPGQPYSVVSEPRLTFSHESDMMGVGWRADSATFATFEEKYQIDGRIDRRLLIWSFDGESAEVTKMIDVGQCFEQIFFNCEVEWSGDGTRIALASASGTQIVTIETGEIEESDLSFAGWTETDAPILAESFVDADYDSIHGRIAVIAKQGDQGASRVEVLDHSTGDVVYQRVFGPDYNFVDSVNFLPDGSGVVLAVNAVQHIWTFADDTLLPLEDVQEVYMTDSRPYGPYIVGFGHASLTHIFDAETGDLVTSLNRYSYDVAVSPDGMTNRHSVSANNRGRRMIYS